MYKLRKELKQTKQKATNEKFVSKKSDKCGEQLSEYIYMSEYTYTINASAYLR